MRMNFSSRWLSPLILAALAARVGAQTMAVRVSTLSIEASPDFGEFIASQASQRTSAWSDPASSRKDLAERLGIADLLKGRSGWTLEVRQASESAKDGYRERQLVFAAPTARFRALLLSPATGQGPWPALICLHDLGGDP